MMIKSLTRTVLAGLIAFILLPAQAWGQDRVIEAVDASPLDFRISNMGPDGDVNFDALHPAVVYNSTDREYLVVWAGDHGVDGEVEIYGQRLSAVAGERLGPAFRISDMGPDGDPAFDAFTPAVAYNDTDNTYLVIWVGIDGPDSGLAVFGQRLNAATGDAIGANDFMIAEASARYPAVAYNGADNEYFVVWENVEEGDARIAEIFGQRLNAATGEARGLGTSRISNLGDDSRGAHRPAVAYNDTDNEYFVVWQGGEEAAPRALEIFGQHLNAATGVVADADPVRVSDMGPDADPAFSAYEPAVAYSRTGHEYLVVWVGDDDAAGMADNEREIFGQRLEAAALKAVGVNDFRISAMGPDGDAAFGAALPAVVYNGADDEYLVVWRGDHNGEALVDGENEIFGQRLFGDRRAGDERGDDDFRISHMGSVDGNTGFDAVQATVVYGGDSYLAVWYGDDDNGSVDNEHEIFGRRIEGDAMLSPAAEEEVVEVPGTFLFSSAHPNPFNTSTTVTLALKEAQNIEISVYDMLGRQVSTLYRGRVEAQQRRTFIFEAGSFPSGSYFVRVVGETFTDTQQVLLVR